NDFREEVRPAPTQRQEIRRSIAKGAFGPSFAADHEQCAAGDAPNQGDEKRKTVDGKGGRKAKKRGYTGESQEVCPACGNVHALEICFYTFPEKAPKWFRFNKTTQEAVDKALAENDQL